MSPAPDAWEPREPLRRDDPRGLAHAVAARLRSAIADGALAPGARVPSEAQLSRGYEVSRTVVREAVSQLRAEGLVETFQGRGSFIAATPGAAGGRADDGGIVLPARRSARDVMELRLAIECEAAALAARRRTRAQVEVLDRALADLREAVRTGGSVVGPDWAIHMAVAVASGNPLLIGVMEGLGAQSVLRHRASLDDDVDLVDPEHGALLVHEHAAIRDAVVRGDADAARSAVRVHLGRSLASLPQP